MGKRLTVQQRKLVKAIVSGKTLTEAAAIAGYDNPANAHRATKKDNFNEAMKAALKRAGLDDNFLTGKIKDLMEAEKPYGKDGDLGPDNGVRLGAVDMALKIGGGYAPTKAEVSGPGGGPIKSKNVTPRKPASADDIAAALAKVKQIAGA